MNLYEPIRYCLRDKMEGGILLLLLLGFTQEALVLLCPERRPWACQPAWFALRRLAAVLEKGCATCGAGSEASEGEVAWGRGATDL